jgi:hypothetical protein
MGPVEDHGGNLREEHALLEEAMMELIDAALYVNSGIAR